MSLFPYRSLVLVLIVGVCFAPTALAQQPAGTVSDTVPLGPDGTVTVDNHEGSITVTTWDRNAVRYEAQIMPTDDDPEAKRTRIRVEHSEARLQLATEHEEGDDESTVFGFTEDGWQWGGIDIPAVHYTIQVPSSTALTIDDHESTIDVTGLAGALSIDTHEGAISVVGHRQDVTIDSHDGPISIANHRGDLTINSHESRMELRRIVGRLTVDTHDADLSVRDLDGRLRLDTHDGEADVSFTALSDDVSVDSHDAHVTIALPAGTGFDLNTDFGEDVDLRSDFDLGPIRIADDDEVNYRGDVNGGGPELYLESHDGQYVLRTRSTEGA